MLPGIHLTTSDVSRLWGIPTGTVHRWAHEDGWTRHGSRADRRWDPNEVQESHDRRRGCGDGAQVDTVPTSGEDPA